jgi:hypothetical protein
MGQKSRDVLRPGRLVEHRVPKELGGATESRCLLIFEAWITIGGLSESAGGPFWCKARHLVANDNQYHNSAVIEHNDGNTLYHVCQEGPCEEPNKDIPEIANWIHIGAFRPVTVGKVIMSKGELHYARAAVLNWLSSEVSGRVEEACHTPAGREDFGRFRTVTGSDFRPITIPRRILRVEQGDPDDQDVQRIRRVDQHDQKNQGDQPQNQDVWQGSWKQVVAHCKEVGQLRGKTWGCLGCSRAFNRTSELHKDNHYPLYQHVLSKLDQPHHPTKAQMDDWDDQEVQEEEEEKDEERRRKAQANALSAGGKGAPPPLPPPPPPSGLLLRGGNPNANAKCSGGKKRRAHL